MRTLASLFLLLTGFVPAVAIENDIVQAEANPASVKILILNGSKNEDARLMKLSSRLVNLEKVVIAGYADDAKATSCVASVAGCNNVREIEFRNCAMQKLPANLRMLTQVKTFTSTRTVIADSEQFYNAIGDMPGVENVNITGSDFRMLPRSFSRMRVMNNVALVNEDLQLARGYDLNTKTPEELTASDTVVFGFGEDALKLSYSCYNEEACGAHLQMFRDVLQGVYRESNVFYTPAQSRIFRKPHPLVKPPVKGMDVFPDQYSFNALTGTSIEYGSGSKISIPAMAFEDINGSPVTGNVDITYREFRDPVDIVLSGIPMKYDSGGVAGDFESAGMFEINASQNGSEVFLKEGKDISIDFAVVDTASTYNFYRLDETKGWQYIENTGAVEEEKVEVAPDSMLPMSEAVRYYVSNTTSIRVKPITKDTTAFDRRYGDTAYIALTKYENADNTFYYKKKREASSKLYLRKFRSGKDYTLVKIAGVKGYSGNPELKAYNGYYWKLDGKYSGAQLRAEYGRKTGINDCRIVDEGGEYFIEFKYSWGFKRLKAEPVRMNRDNKPESLSEAKQKSLFKQYTKRLDNRRNELTRENAGIVKRHNKSVQRAQRDSSKVFERAQRMMVDSEMVMDFPQWGSHVRAEQERVMTAQERAWRATGNVVQALTISGMGVYNCDQVRRLQKPVSAVTQKVKAAGLAIVPFIIYVIDKARNMVLTYSGNGGGGVPITYGGNATNSLLMVDGAGNLYSTNEAQFQDGINKQNGNEFEGELISGPNSNPQTVREAVFPKPN